MENILNEPITHVSDRTYRPNVAAVILSSNYPLKCEFFIAQRNDIKNVWQFPQGGIDENETPQDALLRELKEEIGTNNIEVIANYPKWIRYDFPPSVKKAKKYPFKGQEQIYFLVRLKDDNDIDIQTEIPEFKKFMFLDFNATIKKATAFKRKSYKEVLFYFKKNGYI